MLEIVEYIKSLDPVWAAFIACTGTWLLTAAGASLVFFFKGMKRLLLDTMLGFTGGVMIAASCFGLLGPAIESVDGVGFAKVMPAVYGFLGGAFFIYIIDKLLPHLHINFKQSESEGLKSTWHRTTLLVSAITLHNIPEGLAVGVLFGAAAGNPELLNEAIIVAIGIGIQNFPEGIAVSMPLRREGVGRFKSFWYGQLSAIVEPFAAVIGAVAVYTFEPLLPYGLAFAAGAMIYVVVEEVIPETQRDKYTDLATIGFMVGFIVMMALDVVIGDEIERLILPES
ncbi:MAG: ZIP family metal transporter [Flavobacteriales bacterium]